MILQDDHRARQYVARTDPKGDRRRLIIFFSVLVAVEALGLLLIAPLGFVPAVLIIMFAPALGAIAARLFGPGIIWWGWPSWWIIAGFFPAIVALVALWAASLLGWVDFSSPALRAALFSVPLPLLINCFAGFGEELGWRGFLWPLLRGRFTFLAATAILTPVWLAYHIPGVLDGVYGSIGGLPAFATALLGWVLFIGVVTDRSRSLWPAVLCHAAWNTYLETSYTGLVDGKPVPSFTGTGLVGEFGWVPAVGTLALGVGFAWWHLRSGRGGRLPEPDPTA
jgi:membrane protease YdiL (CAAX protease family)